MRTGLSRVIFLAVLPLLAGATATACGGADDPAQTGTSTGTGGAGGSGGAETTTTTTTAATTGTGGTGGMLDNGMPSDKYPAPHPVTPQVVTYGGPVLKAPRIVPVFFSNDEPTIGAEIKDFEDKIGATQYWAAVTAEYGVGAATSDAPVDLPEAATSTIDDSDIQTWLADELNGDDPAWPAADADTVYVLHYPAVTTITSQGAASCQEFGDRHRRELTRASERAW